MHAPLRLAIRLYGARHVGLLSRPAELTTPLPKLARATRDCLEHQNLRGVVTSDFEMRTDTEILHPSIEIDFRNSRQERCPASWFTKETTTALLNAFEMLVVHACAKNVKAFAGMPVSVGLLPENYRRAWRVRFAYGMYYEGGQFVPIG